MQDDRPPNTEPGVAGGSGRQPDGGSERGPAAGTARADAATPSPTDAREPLPEVVDEAPEREAGAQIAALEAERDQYLEGLKRLKAEFDNYRKRSERERQAQATGAVRDFVASLLPVVDNLERAVAALGPEGSEIFTGVDMVRVQLGDILEGRGVAPIDAHGEAFDPNYHEAVATQPSADHPEGTVVEVVQKGYTHGDAVIRPSRVVVSTRS